jgi:hypothetical protein
MANGILLFPIWSPIFSMIGLLISDQMLLMTTAANRSSVRLKDGLIEPRFGEIAIEPPDLAYIRITVLTIEISMTVRQPVTGQNTSARQV